MFLHFSFVLQHSLIVCLEAPSSPQDHVQMLLAAAPDSEEKALQTAAHHAFIKQSQNLSLLSDEDYMVNLDLLTVFLANLIHFPQNNISSPAKEKSSW